MLYVRNIETTNAMQAKAKSAEALSRRACRARANPQANPLIQSTKPLGGGIYASPLAPPRLRTAQLLAVVPGEVARQTLIKPLKKHNFRFKGLQGANMTPKTAPRRFQGAPKGCQEPPRGSLEAPRGRPTRGRQEACGCWICVLPLEK